MWAKRLVPVCGLALIVAAVGLCLLKGEARRVGVPLDVTPPHGSLRRLDGASGPSRPLLTVPGADLLPDSVPGLPPQWIYLEHEPSFARTLPYDLKGLGPTLALRRYLADQQWASLTTDAGGGPILARFEVVDAESDVSPTDFAVHMPEHYVGRYRVTAILFWAYLSPEDRATPLATYVRRSAEAAGASVEPAGPSVVRVRLAWTQYALTAKNTRPQVDMARGRLRIGDAGWAVEGKPRVVAERTFSGRDLQEVLPIYDLSVCRPVP